MLCYNTLKLYVNCNFLYNYLIEMIILNFIAICGRTEFIMKFRKIIAVVLLVCMTFALASCKSSGSAKQVVEDFMTALAGYDVNAMANCVEDMPTSADGVYIHDIFTEGYYVDLYQIANKDTFKSEIVSAKGDTVKVKVTMPDIYSLYQKTFMSVLTQTFAKEELKDYVLDEKNDPQLMVIALMIYSIENDGIDTVEEEFTLKVGQINGETKIMTNDQLEQLMSSKLILSQKEALSLSTDDAE